MLWVGQGMVPPVRVPLQLRPHLDLQLLHHLHLHPALGRAPVVQGVLCVEVSSGGSGGGEEKVGPGFPSITTRPPTLYVGPQAGEQTDRETERKGRDGENGAKEEAAFSSSPFDVFAKIPATERSNCK